LVRTVCAVAGSTSFLDEIDAEARHAGLVRAVSLGRTPPIFDWLHATFSYQGISDRVARGYMEKHGTATWSGIEAGLAKSPSCPRLQRYWTYEGCRYDKGSFTCSEPEHIAACPVPRPRLRNGRLNQTAYSLFLFIRDLAAGDFVGWIDRQLEVATGSSGGDTEAARQALSALLIGARTVRPHWFETGKSMIAIDTLVHNFLHRTGILHDRGVPHAYGAACYRKGGCAEVVRAVSTRIDARAFNPKFPENFPRFVQHAIWRFCAEDGLAMCNGHRIDDRMACQITYCHLYLSCQRRPLKMSNNQ
jgi:hypothetical protein